MLEGRNAELVGLYRDLLARRATWQSKVETYRGEWSRSNEGVVKVGQRLEEAERARKCSTSEVMGQGRGDSQTDAAKVVALQARAADLRVEIEALRTAKVRTMAYLGGGCIWGFGDRSRHMYRSLCVRLTGRVLCSQSRS